MRFLRLTPIALIATLAFAGAAVAVGASLHAQHTTTTDQAALTGDHSADVNDGGASVGTSLTAGPASVKGAGDAQVTGVPPAPALPSANDVPQLPDPTTVSPPHVGASGDASGAGSVDSDAGHAEGAGGANGTIG